MLILEKCYLRHFEKVVSMTSRILILDNIPGKAMIEVYLWIAQLQTHSRMSILKMIYYLISELCNPKLILGCQSWTIQGNPSSTVLKICLGLLDVGFGSLSIVTFNIIFSWTHVPTHLDNNLGQYSSKNNDWSSFNDILLNFRSQSLR